MTVEELEQAAAVLTRLAESKLGCHQEGEDDGVSTSEIAWFVLVAAKRLCLDEREAVAR